MSNNSILLNCCDKDSISKIEQDLIFRQNLEKIFVENSCLFDNNFYHPNNNDLDYLETILHERFFTSYNQNSVNYSKAVQFIKKYE